MVKQSQKPRKYFLMTYKGLVLDPVNEDDINEIINKPNYQVDINTGLTEYEIVNIVYDYHAVIVRSQTKITERIIQHARSLRVVARAGVGVDNIDIDAATKLGVIVITAPKGNTISATEHTMVMMLALAGDVREAHEELTEGVCERGANKGDE